MKKLIAGTAAALVLIAPIASAASAEAKSVQHRTGSVLLAKTADDTETFRKVYRGRKAAVRIVVLRGAATKDLTDSGNFLYAVCQDRVIAPAQQFVIHRDGNEYLRPDKSADGSIGSASSTGAEAWSVVDKLTFAEAFGALDAYMRHYVKHHTGCTAHVIK